MISSTPRWRAPNIAFKLRLGFGTAFFLVVLILAAWLCSLFLANQARKTISASVAIERTVLNMDRLLEKARRLHNDFLLQYSRIGLAEAHVQFAQPSVRLIAEAVAASAELQNMIAQSAIGVHLQPHHVDLNLYLALAKRFADTSIESIELVTRLAAPERGLEATFDRLLHEVRTDTASSLPVQTLSRQLQDDCQQYRITRQRPMMQSAFNTLATLRRQIDASPLLSAGTVNSVHDTIDRLEKTGEEILATDLAIKNKLHDFSLQTTLAQPIAQLLINQAGIEVKDAQRTIVRTLQTAAVLLLVAALVAVCAGVQVSRFISRQITRRITALTDCAAQMQRGRLSTWADEQPADELGHLGKALNLMSARIGELVDDLEQKIAQRTAQLRESEHRFRQIANELPTVGIIGFDDDRKVFFWNRTCERLYGHSAHQAKGQEVERLIAGEEEQPRLRERLRRWMKEGAELPAEETLFRQADGTPVPVHVSSFTVTGSQGHTERYSLHIDLTELKRVQAESALRESIYRSLFEHTSSGVGVLQAVDNGEDFLIKDVNPAAERIEGAPRHSLIGQRLVKHFPGVEPTGLLARMREVWQSGEPVVLSPMLYQFEDRYRWRQGHLYRIPTGEVVFVYDDITPLKESEQERAAMEAQLQRARKMEAIGLLAGGVAHDLNNILSGIVSYPDLLLMQLPPDSKLRKPVLAIQESGERAAAVVADLLTVARGVSNERKICSLNTLIDEYLHSPEHEALLGRHPGVVCRTECAPELWPLSCSPIHVKKSLMNLVTNGAEAIEHAGRITLRTRNEELAPSLARLHAIDPGRYVVLEVADTGSGIGPADIDHVFEPFYTRKVMGRSGTGLGLAVVWNTIQDHRGAITVASSDRGTVFTLLFPAVHGISEPNQEEEARVTPRGNGETILIVDDEPLQRDIATQMLASLGYQTAAVASGEEAVEFLRTRRVDLVLLDMLMGAGLNGRQTYERIITLNPGQQALIVSGFSESDEVREALRLGVGGYLQKPYSLNALGRAVAGLFQPDS
jgi:PAS domain S-box-containing protein